MAKLEWFGHAGHFIGAPHCRFHLHTHVNGYCVSTVGDYRTARQASKPEEIGCGRLYETMVFKLDDDGVNVSDHTELWCEPYNDRDAANAGHIELVKKWGNL